MSAHESSDQRTVESVLEALDLAIFARPHSSSAGGFRPIGQAPEWFAGCFGSHVTMLTRSAFLDDFVRGAASDSWKADGEIVRSGIWEERADDDVSRFFEAAALKRGNEEVLVLSLADERHRREQRFLQHAHDDALHQRRLAKEREKKEILLDCIVHDLSSPLSTMLLNIQHVERQLDRDDLRQSLHRAETQAERQRALIHSIAHTFASDLSTFEPVLLARTEGVAVKSVAGATVDAFRMEAEQKGVRLELDIDPAIDEHVRVVGDGDHLAGVFDNLLSNALRRSPAESKITMTIRIREGRVRTTVEDEGVPIPDDMRERIFLPFSRRNGGAPFGAGEGENENAQEGNRSELGLYFCKMTVELWGGSIGVEECAGGGNGFWFEVPEQASIRGDEREE